MDILTATLAVIVVFLGLLIPGYAMTYLIFPRKDEIDRLERLALAFALSLVVTPSLMLFENKILSVPINPLTVAANLVGITLFSVVYWKLIWPRTRT